VEGGENCWGVRGMGYIIIVGINKSYFEIVIWQNIRKSEFIEEKG